MFLDLITSFMSLIFFYPSVKRIFTNTSKTLMDYVILVLFVFNALPIVFNVLLGLPKYEIVPWFEKFTISSNNSLVSDVYNIYVLFVFSVAFIYARRKHLNTISKTHYTRITNKCVLRILLFISFLPFLIALVGGHYSSYLIFESGFERGINPSVVQLLMFSEIIGLIAFSVWFFIGKKDNRSYKLILFYYFLILWIDGKRYLMASIIILFIYFYFNSNYCITKKMNMKLVSAIVLPSFLAVYFLYAFAYKINSDVAGLAKDVSYLNYRIDFGRDDVTKLVLYEELVTDKPILNYRGETILSTLFFWIPRSVWDSKPYPHYRYLTAALYGEDLDEVHSGMTPSLFEMSIANLGVVLGIIFTALLLLYLVKLFDHSKSFLVKVLGLIILESLLTQSLDAISSVILMLLFLVFFKIRIGACVK